MLQTQGMDFESQVHLMNREGQTNNAVVKPVFDAWPILETEID